MKFELLPLLACFFLFIASSSCEEKRKTDTPWTQAELLFEYSGVDDWQSQWMLDGERSTVINSEQGMELIAGPEHGNDSCHTVLWTRQSFDGDISIEYDYTRTDTATRSVNILYFHATGKGDQDHPTDISLWNDKRTLPTMRTYFDNMNTYHISYAAFSDKEYSGTNDYIRLRRYNPTQKGLTGTDIEGDHFQTGLFKPFETYHIKVVKYKGRIEMHIANTSNESEQLTCTWDVSAFPSYESGRIGFRHMYTRSARYKDIRIWRIQ